MAGEGKRAGSGVTGADGEKERVLNAWRSMLKAGTMAPTRLAAGAGERGRGAAPQPVPTVPEDQPGREESAAEPEAVPPAEQPEAAPEAEQPKAAERAESQTTEPPEPEPAEPAPAPEQEIAEAPPATDAPPAPDSHDDGATEGLPPGEGGWETGRHADGDGRGKGGRIAAAAVVLIGAIVIVLAVAGVFSGGDDGGGQPAPRSANPPPPAADPPPREQPRRAPRPRTPRTARVAPWPQATRAYTVVLFVSLTDRAAALRRARESVRRGFSAGVLRSDDYSLLEPGYWVTFSGQYRTKGQAQQAVARARRRGLATRPYSVLVNG